MWTLPLDKIQAVLEGAGARWPRVAIETGTGRGNGTRALCRRFARVISIELSPELHARARQRFADAGAGVELWQGDSAVRLAEALAAIAPGEPVFIFLDAHWSGDRTVDWSRASWAGYGVDTAHGGPPGAAPNGPEQCPLLAEFAAIARHCRGEAHLLVDDADNLPPEGPGRRDLRFPGEDWSHLSRERLRAALGSRLRAEYALAEPAQWLLSLAR